MSTKSKRRTARRANKRNEIAAENLPKAPEERRAAGALMGALLNALTLGTLELAPQSAAR